MTSLQLGLIAAGIALVVGVVIYNRLQERRVRRKIEGAFRKPARSADPLLDPAQASAATVPERVEPTLWRGDDPAAAPFATAEAPASLPENAPRGAGSRNADSDAPYEPPLEIKARIASDFGSADAAAPEGESGFALPAAAVSALAAPKGSLAEKSVPQPDPDIECIVTLQPVQPVQAGALAAGLHARLGKPLRWFGRRGASLPWQLLKSDTVGDFSEIAACLLLADRSGAASEPLLDAFVHLVGEIAPTLPAAFVSPDTAREAARAETLDRICADLDVQIGLTVLKPGPATIPGTRLRGVAEAAGFRLVDGGRFDWLQEETGAVLYQLQNYRAEPFTAETLRITSTPGAVFLLDVPRVMEPVRVFDQMRLAARRMTQTLDATLVDDNRRALDDAALAAIRQQVQAAAVALRDMHIEPGSQRALALFGG